MAIGEIVRTLRRLESSQHEQNDKLDAIKAQTAKTNGFVGRHEERLNSLDREMGRRTHPQDRAVDRGDAIAINVPMNAKTITTLLLVLAALIAAVVAKWP